MTRLEMVFQNSVTERLRRFKALWLSLVGVWSHLFNSNFRTALEMASLHRFRTRNYFIAWYQGMVSSHGLDDFLGNILGTFKVLIRRTSW